MSTILKSKFISLQKKESPAIQQIEALFSAGIPKYECELWDYKLLLEDGAYALAELCRDVISFYNSFGGMLIVGISDDFELVGFDRVVFDAKQIKQKCYSICSQNIVVRCEIVRYLSKDLLCIVIPKRGSDIGTAVIAVDGPEKNGRQTFRKGNVYFRADESCQLIRSSEDMHFLASPRHHELDGQPQLPHHIHHNLPDRAMICERFVGRSDAKKELWIWLSDRMSKYRVLAGPGGFGKTSSAYSFAEDIVSAESFVFWQVIWLSAKKQQFYAGLNKFIELPYSGGVVDSFSSYGSLLESICEHLPLTSADLYEVSDAARMQLIKDALKEIPTFFIVDDLDSLSPDDQRMVIDLAMTIGGETARFLITTRKNYLAPASATTQLPGLQGDDYNAYVKVLEGRYDRTLRENEKKQLATETEGSPLFTESIFRLMRLGSRFSDAMKRWKGQDGEAVRAAAFRREIEQLSMTAQRVLFSVSQFDSVSSAEIRNVVELEAPQVEDSLVELEQLFLITSEQIGDEPRFTCAPNLRRLLGEHKSEFIVDHAEIVRRSLHLRQSSNVSGKSRNVSRFAAKAISQAMAQLSDDPEAAVRTINHALVRENSNADLWMVHARCVANIFPLDVEVVRKSFAKSYALGKRELGLFQKWLKFETEYGNVNAAVDVADKAEKHLVPPPWDWLANVAAAYHKRGGQRFSRHETSDAVADFRIAEKQLSNAINLAPWSARSSVRGALDKVNQSLEAARTKRV